MTLSEPIKFLHFMFMIVRFFYNFLDFNFIVVIQIWKDMSRNTAFWFVCLSAYFLVLILFGFRGWEVGSAYIAFIYVHIHTRIRIRTHTPTNPNIHTHTHTKPPPHPTHSCTTRTHMHNATSRERAHARVHVHTQKPRNSHVVKPTLIELQVLCICRLSLC